MSITKTDTPGSSSIASVTYDDELDILDIEFRKSGKTSRFHGVSAMVVRGLLEAQSKGTFFARNIRKHYRNYYLN